VEDYVNLRVQQDHPVKCWFPDAEALAALPLRKAPTVSEHVRIVAMGDFEMVACGGTHPSTTGQIGFVKIVSTQPVKGKVRVSFVCGERAWQDYRRNYDAVWAAANLLSTRPEHLAHILENTLERLHSAEHELAKLRREQLLSGIPAMLAAAEAKNGLKIVCQKIDGDATLARELASALIEHPNTIVLIGANAGDKCALVFGRSSDLELHMGKLLSECAKPFGGKGGGKPDFAQGGGPAEILEAARKKLLGEDA